jgi:hypothetical protein
MDLTDSFRVWIPKAPSGQLLVRKSDCHQVRQRNSSTVVQQTHRATHALHQKAHS